MTNLHYFEQVPLNPDGYLSLSAKKMHMVIIVLQTTTVPKINIK